VLGGTTLILNLRLLGLRFSGDPVSELAADVAPWTNASLAVMLLSGFLLFSSESVKMYGSTAFRLKMIFLLTAIAFTYSVHRRVVRAEGGLPPFAVKLVAVTSLLLWAGVGIAGRAIGIT
jgi:hypothetical protein